MPPVNWTVARLTAGAPAARLQQSRMSSQGLSANSGDNSAPPTQFSSKVTDEFQLKTRIKEAVDMARFEDKNNSVRRSSSAFSSTDRRLRDAGSHSTGGRCGETRRRK